MALPFLGDRADYLNTLGSHNKEDTNCTYLLELLQRLNEVIKYLEQCLAPRKGLINVSFLSHPFLARKIGRIMMVALISQHCDEE